MKYNAWLEDSNFLLKMDFKDKYYLEVLLHKVAAFLKNTPIPIIATWDNKFKSIYFKVWDNKKFFSVDVNVSYPDMITLIKRWTKQFYPSYEVIVRKEIEYTEEEILTELVGEKKMDLNDALLARKNIEYTEIGVIEKVFIARDEFILNVNGIDELRMSGTIKNPTPLSEFMENIRNLKQNDLIKNYIVENSRLVTIIQSTNSIPISYSGKQMINFFKINFTDKKDYELKQIDEFNFTWDNFLICFNSKTLRDDCLTIYRQKMAKVNV